MVQSVVPIDHFGPTFRAWYLDANGLSLKVPGVANTQGTQYRSPKMTPDELSIWFKRLKRII
jgi:hypothetical protein